MKSDCSSECIRWRLTKQHLTVYNLLKTLHAVSPSRVGYTYFYNTRHKTASLRVNVQNTMINIIKGNGVTKTAVSSGSQGYNNLMPTCVKRHHHSVSIETTLFAVCTSVTATYSTGLIQSHSTCSHVT